MQSQKSRAQRDRKDDETYPVNELARMNRCSGMHIRRLIAAGELPAIDISAPGSGRPKLRIRASDWADYLDRQALRGIA
jgi:hypothetical protein